jgi:hypothetical protein
MFDLIVKWFTEIGTVAKVYTEVDYYVYIKAVEYLIAIGFFVVYALFWKRVFKPDHWADSKKGKGGIPLAGIILLAAVLLPAGAAAAAPAVPGTPSAPGAVTIDSLANIFGPVEFDHAMHVDLADGCATCHHHTTGEPEAGSSCTACHTGKGRAGTVSCKGCHSPDPFTAANLGTGEEDGRRFHIDKPGLKGAYHLGCLGCHKEMGAPTGCRECHALSAMGEAFYRIELKEGKP